HLAIAHPAITMIDLDPPAWFTSATPRGGFTQDGAWLRLCGGPGLGLELLPADVDPASPTASPSGDGGGRWAAPPTATPPARASPRAPGRMWPSPRPRCGWNRTRPGPASTTPRSRAPSTSTPGTRTCRRPRPGAG